MGGPLSPLAFRFRNVADRRPAASLPSLVQTNMQKLTQAQRIGGPPCDPSFRVDAFEVPNQQQAKVTFG